MSNLLEWCEQNNQMSLLREWDHDKNGSPSLYSHGSGKRVSWICSRCGFQWMTRISARTCAKATGCRRCSRRRNSSFPEQAIYYYMQKYFPDAINGDKDVIPGRELDVYIPSISVAIEYDGKKWHKEINKDISKDLLCKQKDIVLYRVREAAKDVDLFTESIAYVYDFQDWHALDKIILSILGDCGIDSPDVDIERDTISIKEIFFDDLGQHSLSALYPQIAAEWDADKNGVLKPSMISPNDHDEYWWICPLCHVSYKAIVKNRTSKLCGCNACGSIEGGRKQMSRVRNITTGQVFDSLSDAAASIGVSKAAIVKACQGQNKTCKGFRWEYFNRSDDHRPQRLRQPTQRPILNVDTGKIYNSLSEAIMDTGITNISAVCRGLRQTAGGFRWKYKDDKE